MNIEKFLHRRNIFVLIRSTNQRLQHIKQQQEQHLVILNPHIIAKPRSTTPKPKMSNSFEYLQDSTAEIQKKYETLSDIVSEYGGKVHGSQRDRDPKTGLIDLLVYSKVKEGKRDEVKSKFSNYIISIVAQ